MNENLNVIHEEVTSFSDGGPIRLESVSAYVRVQRRARRQR